MPSSTLMTAGEYAVATDYRGNVNTLFREFEKTAGEIQALQASSNTLQATIATLEAELAAAQAAGTPSQALVDAVAAVKAQAQVVDDLIPDAQP